jgi:hypothetical protein
MVASGRGGVSHRSQNNKIPPQRFYKKNMKNLLTFVPQQHYIITAASLSLGSFVSARSLSAAFRRTLRFTIQSAYGLVMRTKGGSRGLVIGSARLGLKH